ncbi:MAG: methyltransferase [Hamadaea sp.]|uniref:class I SAM-dependent methyltransferase n=1 Tax=Hamadaea sp. TaxID=2024425 RepID=UPI001803292B|nr:50S ribosomal protein L11 methyltransferase [Hamadaea sp.]NUR73879.1 methyltransferase [Hamadaea sp.]NUT20623.1 methyltransferase [Hamadaea sp.]
MQIDFVRAHTEPAALPFLPELKLRQAAEAIPLWELMEQVTGRKGLPPPFWAFAWAGGQGLARYVLDHPATVAGQTVLDLAAGSGLVALAAARAGASRVIANEIDEYADAAIALNADLNGVAVERALGDLLRTPPEVPLPEADVVLAGDVFYSRDMAAAMLGFLRRQHERGALVLVGDPGRAYRPTTGFEQVAAFRVPVNADLEDADLKHTTVLRMV